MKAAAAAEKLEHNKFGSIFIATFDDSENHKINSFIDLALALGINISHTQFDAEKQAA
jgi:hypothetical protein